MVQDLPYFGSFFTMYPSWSANIEYSSYTGEKSESKCSKAST
jgi:hypothetical protein